MIVLIVCAHLLFKPIALHILFIVEKASILLCFISSSTLHCCVLIEIKTKERSNPSYRLGLFNYTMRIRNTFLIANLYNESIALHAHRIP